VWEHSEIGWLFVFVQLWWWLLSKDEKQLIFFEGSSFRIPYVSGSCDTYVDTSSFIKHSKTTSVFLVLFPLPFFFILP
jgi:hypothetical protein